MENLKVENSEEEKGNEKRFISIKFLKYFELFFS